MRPLLKLLPAVIAVFVLMDGDRPPLASADGCQGCSSNSPIINPFPIMWLRSGTSPVLRGISSSTCKYEKFSHPVIAIEQINQLNPLDRKQIIRGYQLVVVDKLNKTIPPCRGTDLIGVTYTLSKGRSPVLIQQIAKTEVLRDLRDLDKSPIGTYDHEYRLVYLITSIAQADDSLCSHSLSRTSWLHRMIHKDSSYSGSNIIGPERTSDPFTLFDILPDQLSQYAVIIPNAEYDNDGTPYSSDDPKHPLPTNLEPLPPSVPKNLEWFELACAGGALAHTDLTGMVKLDEPRYLRTAALRMFQAQYSNDISETLDGVPIRFKRNAPYPCTDYKNCSASTSLGPGEKIEAVWNDKGATCMSHSRLWMKNTIISRTIDSAASRALAPTSSLPDSEQEFIQRLNFGEKKCSKNSSGFFTSYTENHITHITDSE